MGGVVSIMCLLYVLGLEGGGGRRGAGPLSTGRVGLLGTLSLVDCGTGAGGLGGAEARPLTGAGAGGLGGARVRGRENEGVGVRPEDCWVDGETLEDREA